MMLRRRGDMLMDSVKLTSTSGIRTLKDSIAPTPHRGRSRIALAWPLRTRLSSQTLCGEVGSFKRVHLTHGVAYVCVNALDQDYMLTLSSKSGYDKCFDLTNEQFANVSHVLHLLGQKLSSVTLF